MVTSRIRAINEISKDLDKLLQYIPFQKIEYSPDPAKSVMERFGDAFAAVMRQARVCHIPGTRLAGCGGEKFYARPAYLVQKDLDAIREYPKNCSEETIQAINEEFFYVLPYNAGHIIENHEAFLTLGINGIIDEIETRLKDTGLTEVQRMFLTTAKREWEEAKDFAKRHEEYYRKLAQETADEAEKREYLDIAELIGRVPANPASTFKEALQSVWFVYLCAQMDDVANHSLGRLDQYLYKYYRNDIDSGALDAETARELFYDFWLKYTQGYTVSQKLGRSAWKGVGDTDMDAHNGLSWMVTKIIDDKHVDDGQTINIGGLDYAGEDATNELSWFALDAVRELKSIEPKPVVKFSAKTDPKFMDACYRLLADGCGLPAIAYDDGNIRALEREPDNRYSREDLIDNCHIGCIEPAAPGNSYVDPMSAFVNLPKILSLTLDNGVVDGCQIGLAAPEAKTWQEFLDGYLAQMRHIVDRYVEATNRSNPFYNRYFFRPLTSTLLDGCIQKALMAEEGGTVHWSKSINCCGLATTADSLAAIKKVVFDDKEMTLEQLNKILHEDYAGNEPLRQRLINKISKYGNGEQEVDDIARLLVGAYCDHVSSRRTHNGLYYRPGLYSFYATVRRQGAVTPATPNGRKAGQPFSLNIAPAHGAIKNGMTAVLQSVMRFDHTLAPNACPVDVHLQAGTPVEVVRYINEYIGKSGGVLSQFTVANRDDMRNAQKAPERYQDLIVRVTGFSAQFISLDKGTQDEILDRSYWDAAK